MTSTEKEDFLHKNGDFVRCIMNDDAKLYHKSNYVQMRDAIICLDEYTPRMKWNDGTDRIIDIGCGDGGVTNVIKKNIPKNYKELIGCDINERMVNFANENFRDEKSYFRVLDIEDNLPEELKGRFNHVFSFYALHWVKKQVKAFTNIFNMLTSGGDCILAFLGHMPIYTAYWAVASKKKWKEFIPSCKEFMSPYHHLQEPEKHIKIMLNKIGFKNIEVNCKQMSVTYSIETLRNTIRSINPFPMPEESVDKFLDDFIIMLRDMRLMNNVEEDIDVSDLVSAIIPYNLIVVYATK